MNFQIGQIADACGGELVLQGKGREEQVWQTSCSIPD